MLLFVCVLLLSVRLADAQPSAPQPQAYIRVVQDDGVWWFQDGAGRRFFSLGVNCVGGCYGHAEATPMLPARRQWIVALLHNWGFNTAGCWSSPSVWPDFYVAEQIYVDFGRMPMMFRRGVLAGPFADHLEEEVKPFRGQPMCWATFWTTSRRGTRAHFAFISASGSTRRGVGLCLPTSTRIIGADQPPESGVGHRVSELAQLPGTRLPPVRDACRGIVQAWRTRSWRPITSATAMVRALDPIISSRHRYRGCQSVCLPRCRPFLTSTPSTTTPALVTSSPCMPPSTRPPANP